MKRVLILDDSLTICLMLKSWLVKQNYKVQTATSVAEAKEMVKDEMFDLILSDIRMPEDDGLSFLSWVQRFDSEILVIMMTGYADIETAVESMKAGAIDYVAKPIAPELLIKKIQEAFNKHEAENSSQSIANTFLVPPGNHNRKLAQQIDSIASSNQHALIIGEPGTGKSSVVKYIYENGVRKSNSFAILDCGEHLERLQNDMHEETECGHSLICSYMSRANNGLLFVRKIHALPPSLQNDLATSINNLKEKGRTTQVIAGTYLNKVELQKVLIPELFRLFENKCIELPPLRGRSEDILFFADFFLQFANLELNKEIEGFHPLVEKQLIEYDWPGNIQELKNTVLKAALLTAQNEMSVELIPLLFDDKLNKKRAQVSSLDSLKKENWEKQKIIEALKHAEGNKTLAAKMLDIDRKTLYNKIKLYRIN